MITLAHTHTQPSPNTDTVQLTTTLLNAAADLETKLRDRDQCVQALAQHLRWAEIRQDRTRRWLKALSASLRNHSHYQTTQLLRRILREFNTGDRP